MDGLESTVLCDYKKRSVFPEQYYVLDNMLRYWHILFYLAVTITLFGKYYYPDV